MFKEKIFVTGFLFASLLGMIANSEISSAESKTYYTLKMGSTYKFNLDQSGAKEKIRYVVEPGKEAEESDEDDIRYESVRVIIYINGKEAYAAKFEADEYEKIRESDFKKYVKNHIKVAVTDVDTSDKQMEVFIEKSDFGGTWYNPCEKLYYLKYKNKQLTKEQDLINVLNRRWYISYSKGIKNYFTSREDHVDNIASMRVFNTKGDGTITFSLCKFNTKINYLHFKTNLLLKNGKFVNEKKEGIIKSADYERFITAGKDAKAYTSASIKASTAFVVKKGNKLTMLSVQIVGKNLYIKVKNSSGKTGYVSPNAGFKIKPDYTLHV